MSFVPGGSLQERIDQLGVLSLPEILRIGHQIATGLQSAHAKSIVHRDVKPANVLIEDGLDKIKLTDFGLARSIDDVKLTHLGIVAGTPQYMSPEQTRGDKVDFRSDLFSLGITLYTMSTGTLPFRAEESLSVMNQICETRPAPMQELNPDIPAWLDTLVSKAMRKSPDDRFQSAAEMAELLKLCLAHIEQPSLVPIPACLSSSSTHTLGSITSSVGIRWIAASLFAISLAALSIWAVFFNEPVHPLAQTTSPDTAFDLVAPHDPEVIWLPGQVLPGKNQIFSFEQGVLRGHIFTRTTEDGHLVLAVNGIGFDSKIPFRDTHLRLVDESGRVVPMQGLRAAIPSNSKLLRISYTQRSILPFKSPALICLKVEPPDEKEKDVD